MSSLCIFCYLHYVDRAVGMREETEDKNADGKTKAPNSRVASPSRSGSPLSLPIKESLSLSTVEKSLDMKKELISPLTDLPTSKDTKHKAKKEGFPVGAGMQVVRNLAK